jgi:acyl carrier protein
MTQTDVIAKLQGIFDDIFLDKVNLAPELSARDVEEWDSLIQINLVVAVESAFKIRFRVGEVEATQNVGQFADLIARRAAEASAG